MMGNRFLILQHVAIDHLSISFEPASGPDYVQPIIEIAKEFGAVHDNGRWLLPLDAKRQFVEKCQSITQTQRIKVCLPPPFIASLLASEVPFSQVSRAEDVGL
jgi:hypothetical protein